MKLKSKKVEKANLRNHAEGGNYKKELLSQLVTDLKVIKSEIKSLTEKQKEIESQILSLEIEPFEIGGYALVEITSGRSKKWQKCLLECVEGILYARPVKENGELSGRHFSLISITKPYSELLKEVEE